MPLKPNERDWSIRKALGLPDPARDATTDSAEDERKKKEQELERERRRTALERGFKK